MTTLDSQHLALGEPAVDMTGRGAQPSQRPSVMVGRLWLLAKASWPWRGRSVDSAAGPARPPAGAKGLAYRLHRSIIIYSVLAILAVGVSVALVGVAPLYGSLRVSQAQGLNVAAHTREVAVREFINRVESIANQVSIRTQARRMLDAHAKGELELDKLVAFTDKALADAAAGSPVLAGGVRTNARGLVVGRAGQAVADSLWPAVPERPEVVQWLGPYVIDGQDFLVARTRIHNAQAEFIGSDTLLFRARELRILVEDRSGLGRSGLSALLTATRSGYQPAFGEPSARADESAAAKHVATPGPRALASALRAPDAAAETTTFLVARTPVPGTPWVVAVGMDKGELYAPINDQLWPIVLVVAVLLAGGTTGMALLLKPLAGKVVVQAGELETQVAQKTSALGRELEERRRVEVSLQATAADLERRTRALQAANQELEQFAYVASHDLKAPLRAISNLATWISEDLGDRLEAGTRKHIDLLRGRVLRMEGLIDGILRYSRIGRVSAEVEVVDTGSLLAEVVDGLAPPPGFVIEIGPGMPTLETTRIGLHQVFANLISNAVKYHDRPEGRVAVSVRDIGDWYEFVVSDDGPGIDAEYHDKIFAIFQTLQARDKKESTGVGLTIVKKVIESQGGTISVRSAVGAGAAFLFTWPRAARKEQ